MICTECNSTESAFNEVLGETECVGCGLVLISEPFEQEVSFFDAEGNLIRSKDRLLGSKAINKYDRTTPTHIIVGMRMTTMLAVSITDSKSIVERCEKAYMSCFRRGVFGLSTFEVRASALVYYVLRERNLPFSLKEICKEYGVKASLVARQAKAIASHFKNPAVFQLTNGIGVIEKYAERLGGLEFSRTCGILFSFFEKQMEERHENFRPFTHGAIMYIAGICEYKRFTQDKIAETVDCSKRTIQVESKKLLAMVGKTRSQIEGRGVDWIW